MIALIIFQTTEITFNEMRKSCWFNFNASPLEYGFCGCFTGADTMVHADPSQPSSLTGELCSRSQSRHEFRSPRLSYSCHAGLLFIFLKSTPKTSGIPITSHWLLQYFRFKPKSLYSCDRCWNVKRRVNSLNWSTTLVVEVKLFSNGMLSVDYDDRFVFWILWYALYKYLMTLVCWWWICRYF